MGILIIDGNSVFEIDEECVKKKNVAVECDIKKYMTKENIKSSNTKEIEKKT